MVKLIYSDSRNTQEWSWILSETSKGGDGSVGRRRSFSSRFYSWIWWMLTCKVDPASSLYGLPNPSGVSVCLLLFREQKLEWEAHFFPSLFCFPDGNLPPASLHSSPFPFNILDISSAAAISYLSLSTIYKVLSIVTVLLHLSNPGDWYPLFGNVKNCTSLRNVWDGSHFWHGLHRDTLVRISKSLINCLPLRQETKQPSTRQRSTSNSKLYDFLLLVFVFSLSTSLHVVGTFAMNRSWKGSVKFFLIQIVGVSLEGQVGKLVGAGLDDRIKKVLGYLWVASWCEWLSSTEEVGIVALLCITRPSSKF